MFRLESYVAPLLMGYIDKYVKLNKDDFQMSLWGGDVVLNKLELRLNVFENLIPIPISVKSGWVHELRVHVPWTHLYSEPVVITINTIETTVTLNDQEDISLLLSKSPQNIKKNGSLSTMAERDVLPPGYLQSLINKILNNINIVINNLILKFVEDDIVLSLNIKSAEYYSVDQAWKRSFIDLTSENLQLRKIFEVHDLTLCLDQRDGSGKILHYQVPMLYKCALSARLCTSYESPFSKVPLLTQLNILCTRLNISFTDLQIPLFHKLTVLFHNLFNHNSSFTESPLPSHTSTSTNEESSKNLVEEPPSSPQTNPEEGWISWVWSYIPAFLPPSQGSDLDALIEFKTKNENSIFMLGLYFKNIRISLKHCEILKTSRQEKLIFKTYLTFNLNNLDLDIKTKGTYFSDVQLGLDQIEVFFHCNCLESEDSKDSDYQTSKNDEKLDVKTSLFKELMIFSGGKPGVSCPIQPSVKSNNSLFEEERGSFIKTTISTLTEVATNSNNQTEQSLNQLTSSISSPSFSTFPFSSLSKVSPPSSSSFSSSSFTTSSSSSLPSLTEKFFPEDEKEHFKIYSHDYAKENYNLFWLDSLSILQQNNVAKEHRHIKNTTRIFIGPSHLNISSKLLNTVEQIISSLNFQFTTERFKPLSSLEQVDSRTNLPTKEEVDEMKKGLLNCCYYIEVLNPSLTLFSSYDRLKNHFDKHKHQKLTSQQLVENPVLQLNASTISSSFLFSSHSKIISKIASLLGDSSSNLISNCQSHLNVEIKDLSMTLNLHSQSLPPLQILQVSLLRLKQRSFIHPYYWHNNLQPQISRTFEGEKIILTLTKPQLLLISYIVASWFSSQTNHFHFHNLSIIEDAFYPSQNLSSSLSSTSRCSMEVDIPSFELKHLESEAVHCFHGCITSFFVIMLHNKDSQKHLLPILYGPLNLQNISSNNFFLSQSSFFSSSSSSFSSNLGINSEDLLTFSFQIQKDIKSIQAPGGLFFKLFGICALLDPIVLEWLAYEPRKKDREEKRETGVTINTNILIATDPLKENSSLKGSESGSQPSLSFQKQTTEDLNLVPPAQEEKTYLKNSSSNSFQNEVENTERLKRYLLGLYPLLRVLEVEVDISSSCLIAPLLPIHPLAPPSVDIPLMIYQLFSSFKLSDTFILTLPHFQVTSAGSKPLQKIPQLPIKSLDQSLAGEKFPWKLTLTGASVYSLHENLKVRPLVEPFSVKSSMAINAKRCPLEIPSSEDNDLKHLAFCFHFDLNHIQVHLANQQIVLLIKLLLNTYSAMNNIIKSFQYIYSVLNPSSISSSSIQPLIIATPLHSPKVLSNSSIQDGIVFDTFSSENFSSSTREDEENLSFSRDSLSLWIQSTISKLSFHIYLPEPQLENDFCLLTEFNETTLSLDAHEVYLKLTAKINAFSSTLQVLNQPNLSYLLLASNNIVLPEELRFTLTSRLTSAKEEVFLKKKEEIKSKEETDFFKFIFTKVFNDESLKICNKLYDSQPKKKMHYSSSSSFSSFFLKPSYLKECCFYSQPFFFLLDVNLINSIIFVINQISDCFACQNDNIYLTSSKPSGLKNYFFSSFILPLIHVSFQHFFIILLPHNVIIDTFLKHPILPPLSNHDDPLIFYFDKISIIPHSSNPLPRTISNHDLMNKATSFKLFGSSPGLPLEDRQYQINLKGFSCGFFPFKTLEKKLIFQKNSDPLLNLSQNPAFEWNTSFSTKETVEDLKPLMISSPVNIHLIVAPAVVAFFKNHEASMVCSPSIEVNIEPELELFFSCLLFEKLSKLFHSLFLSSFSPPSSSFSSPSESASSSSLTSIFGQIDLLVTGIRLNIFCYSYNKKNNLFKPLFNLLLSQPYFLLKSSPNQLQLDVSFYDISIKSNNLNENFEFFSLTNDLHFHTSHYGTFDLETKPGKPHKTTGVSASVFLLSYKKNDSKVDVSVLVDRPIRCSVNTNKILNFINFLESLKPFFSLKQPSPSFPFDGHESVLFDWLENISISTVQLVLRWCGEDEHKSIVSFGLNSSNIKMQNSSQKKECKFEIKGESLICCLATKDNSRSSSLLSPSNISISLILKLNQNKSLLFDLFPPFSSLTYSFFIFIFFSSLKITISIEEAKKLKSVILEILNILKIFKSEKKNENENSKIKKEENILKFEDDLKSKQFKIIDKIKEKKLESNEMFYESNENEAFILWKYSNSRCISCITSSPVPFSTPSPEESSSVSQEIPCYLQYSLNDGLTFHDYASFLISSDRYNTVSLDTITTNNLKYTKKNTSSEKFNFKNNLVTAQVWKALLKKNKNDQKEENSSLILNPLVLAACLKVDSVEFEHFTPSFTLNCLIDFFQFQILYDPPLLHSVKTTYQHYKPRLLERHGLLLFFFLSNDFSLLHLNNNDLIIKLSTSLRVKAVDHQTLNFKKFISLDGLSLQFHINYLKFEIFARCSFRNSFLSIDHSKVKIFNLIHSLFQEAPGLNSTQTFVAFFFVCNNLETSLYFGQAETKTKLKLESREMYQFVWTMINKPKKLWFSLKPPSSNFFSNKSKKTFFEIEKLEEKNGEVEDEEGTKFHVSLSKINLVQWQITVNGQLVIGNQCNESFNLKLVGSSENSKAFYRQIKPLQLLPSLHLQKNQKILISLETSTSWSEEIFLKKDKNIFFLHKILKLPGVIPSSVCLSIHFQPNLNFIMLIISPLYCVVNYYPKPIWISLKHNEILIKKRLASKGQLVRLSSLSEDLYDVTFQLGSQISPSSSFFISLQKLDQTTPQLSLVDFNQVINNWEDYINQFNQQNKMDIWPFNSLDSNILSSTQKTTFKNFFSNKNMKEKNENKEKEKIEDEEDITMEGELGQLELSIDLSQHNSLSKCLLIQISPRWMIINETPLIFSLLDSTSSFSRLLPSFSCQAPPFMVRFKLAINIGSIYYSEDIFLSEHQVPPPYQPPNDLHLAVFGHIVLYIPIFQKGTNKYLYISLHSTWSHQCRMVTIREHFCLINHLPHSIYILPLLAPSFSSSTSFSYLPFPGSPVKIGASSSSKDLPLPLFFWHSTQELLDNNFKHYLIFKSGEDLEDIWSPPVELNVTSQQMNQHLLIPLYLPVSPYSLSTLPCSLRSCQEKGLKFFVLDEEKDAFVILHNNLCLDLYLDLFGDKNQVLKVSSQCSSYFCPIPSNINSTSFGHFYPFSINIGLKNQKRFEKEKKKEKWNLEIFWSKHKLLIPNKEVTFFFKAAQHSFKVETRFLGHKMHLSFDHVNKIDSFYKEVIKSKKTRVEKVQIVNAKSQKEEEGEIKKTLYVFPPEEYFFNNPTLKLQLDKSLELELPLLGGWKVEGNFFWPQVSIFFSESNKTMDFLYIYLQKLFISIEPLLDFTKRTPSPLLQLTFYLQEIQVDNRLFNEGVFDFPVIIIPNKENIETSHKNLQTSSSLLNPFVLQNPFFSLNVSLYIHQLSGDVDFLDVVINIEPVVLNFEDSFFYKLLDYLHSFFFSSSFFPPSTLYLLDSVLPADVKLITSDLRYPLRLNNIKIGPLQTLISFKASLTFFFALESIPMTFPKFENSDVWLTKQQFSKLITMHYAVNALLRTGVVLGSLEILGNPTGFVRNVGSGVYDLIHLPYMGMTLGPASCITGFSNGIKSVFKHISAGTLNSISNFASGISRNMERLSLDEDHRDRIHRLRSRKPRGLADGLSAGLLGFGLSLLGAVAGIANHPLQPFMTSEDLESSVSSKAKGVMTGLGKGLLGVITKPIGGAAELVSMTSMGLMQGTGLVHLPKQKIFSDEEENQESNYSQNRLFILSNLIQLSEDELLLSTLPHCLIELKDPCVLLLTSQLLHLFDETEVHLLSSLPLSNVSLHLEYPFLSIFLSNTSSQEDPDQSSDSEETFHNDRLNEYLKAFDSSTNFLSPCNYSSLKYKLKVKNKAITQQFVNLFIFFKLNSSSNQFSL